MRYRKLDANGDYVVGTGSDFLINSPAAVAQAISTALLLFQGEWFLDSTAGVPWLTQVVGYGTQSLYDEVIKEAILGVTGVQAIISYSSSVNELDRVLTVTVEVTTIFDNQSTVVTVPIPPPIGFGEGGFGEGGFGGTL